MAVGLNACCSLKHALGVLSSCFLNWDCWGFCGILGVACSLSELGFMGLGGFLGFCCCGLGGVALGWVRGCLGCPARLFAPVALTLALSRCCWVFGGEGALFIAGEILVGGLGCAKGAGRVADPPLPIFRPPLGSCFRGNYDGSRTRACIVYGGFSSVLSWRRGEIWWCCVRAVGVLASYNCLEWRRDFDA